MPSKDEGKERGSELIGFGEKRARKKQRSFYVNEIEDKILDDEQKKLGFETFREYVMAQLHFCRRYDKGEKVLKERIDAMLKSGEGLKEPEGIDPLLHPEMVKELKKLTVEAISQYHIMRALLQRPRQTYEELKRGVEAFLSLAGHEFAEVSFQNQLIVLIAQNIVSCDDELQPEIYSLVVIEDLLQKLATTLHLE